MSIRFRCPSCSQPIEIDDDWGSKLVACPFCRNTVTAPVESTLSVEQSVPMADTLTAPDMPVGMAPAAQYPPPFPTEAGPRNTLAIVSLVVALASATLLIVGVNVYFSNVIEIFGEDLYTPGGDMSEQQQAVMTYIQDYFETHGGPPPWMVGSMLSILAGGLGWLAAVICGGIAVARRQRRRWAIAALVICGIVPFIACCPGSISLARTA